MHDFFLLAPHMQESLIRKLRKELAAGSNLQRIALAELLFSYQNKKTMFLGHSLRMVDMFKVLLTEILNSVELESSETSLSKEWKQFDLLQKKSAAVIVDFFRDKVLEKYLTAEGLNSARKVVVKLTHLVQNVQYQTAQY